MNFFRHQERARRKTWLLATYFALAVMLIAAVVNLCFYVAFSWLQGGSYPLRAWLGSAGMWWTLLLTLAIILGGSLRKAWQLRKGGSALAALLGAREVTPDARGADERRLRNVVEEMAIASGIPAPRTYVLEQESAINALVAGYRPTEAVLMVTAGALQQLNREELQGVVAHEFSHIFNADMRLNMRLIAVLAGILAIGKVGELLLHSNTRARYNRRSGKNEAAGVAFLIVLGLVMMVIGYVGLFFGRLIKAAISRQRELLADASSVQFTRNASGIANALIKIRNQFGSHLLSSHGEDMSHMCFGASVPFHLQSLLATHPPLDDRLRALGGDWLARARARQRQGNTAPDPSGAATPLPEEARGFAASSPAAVAGQVAALGVAGLVGRVAEPHLGYARSLYQSIPDTLRQALQQPQPASWAMYALTISVSRGDRDALLSTLPLTTLERQMVAQYVHDIHALGTRVRLPLVDLAIPALKQLDTGARQAFLAQLDQLVRADRHLSLFEFVLTRILADHLAPRAERATRVRFRDYRAVATQLQLVLSLMVHASGAREAAAEDLFRRTGAALLPTGTRLLPLAECRTEALEAALHDLRDLSPLLKGPLLDGLADVAREDGRIQVQEAELLRAVATLMDCPMPPLFPAETRVA